MIAAPSPLPSLEPEIDDPPKTPGGIVVGIDGSPESIAAFNAASALATLRDCALHIVSVIPPYGSYHMTADLDESQSEIDSLRINVREVAIRTILETANPSKKPTHEIVTGRAARAIVESAERRGADLIVVGNRHQSPMDRILGGETTLQVIRMASVPVVAVGRELDPIRSIVVATDFSPSSTRSAQLALSFLGKEGRLYLTHVEPADEGERESHITRSTGRFPGDLVIWFRRQQEQLQVPEGVIVETISLCGKPADEVLDFAERVHADMITGGTHGHAGLERFLLGSVSTALVRNTRCAVMIAPPPEVR
jgi:nucleotide-binding universal stress UspA family protein